MKYAPLQDHLRSLPSSKSSVTLTFKEIEKIIGTTLPKSASIYQEWWANQSYGSQAPSWLGAGFIVDRVDVNRKIVSFLRDSGARTKQKKRAKARKQPANRKPIAEDVLLNAGFKKFGKWALNEDGGINLVGDIPTEPGVYAHVLNGKVCYIGSATMGLKKRLYFYAKPGSTQRTSIRINGLIIEQLKAGNNVEVIAAFPEPSSWNDLPVDLVTGLETGLVKTFSPPWNKRGVAG